MIFLILFWHSIKIHILHRIQIVVHTNDRIEDADDHQPDITSLNACGKDYYFGYKTSKWRHSRQRQERSQYHESKPRRTAAHASVIFEVLESGDPTERHDDTEGKQISQDISCKIK